MTDAQSREALCRIGRSLFDRGFTHGSTGNLSLRTAGGILMTPTGTSLRDLDPAKLSLVGPDGTLISGNHPTKECALHLAMYRARPDDISIVHTHGLHSTALSVLSGLSEHNVLPALTAYYAMRIGRLPLVPYFPPGDPGLAAHIEKVAQTHHAFLLANHGPIVSGRSLEGTADALEELEATARMWWLVRHESVRTLSNDEVAELARLFPR